MAEYVMNFQSDPRRPFFKFSVVIAEARGAVVLFFELGNVTCALIVHTCFVCT